jgi:hypothetical protein
MFLAESAYDHVYGALIVAIGAITAQTVTAVLSWFQSRHNSKQIADVKTEQVAAKHEINSRLTELLASVRAESLAQGRLEGIEEQKRRAETGDKGTTT